MLLPPVIHLSLDLCSLCFVILRLNPCFCISSWICLNLCQEGCVRVTGRLEEGECVFLFPVGFLQSSCLLVCAMDFQFSSVTQLCPTLCDPMDWSTPGFPVHHQLLELTQAHVHHVSDVIQLSHPLPSPSPPAFNLSQHQGLFQWVSSSHQVPKVLDHKRQLQHQSF